MTATLLPESTAEQQHVQRLIDYIARLERSLAVCRARGMRTLAKSYERQIAQCRGALALHTVEG